MNPNSFDKWWKAILALLLFVFIILYRESSQIGRYQFFERQGTFFFLDSQTGELYTTTAEAAIAGDISRWMKIEPKTGLLKK